MDELKSRIGKEGLEEIMLMAGADDEQEMALIMNAQVHYTFQNDEGIRNKRKNLDPHTSDEEFDASMWLLMTNKEVRKAYMEGDYEKCQEFTDVFLGRN